MVKCEGWLFSVVMDAPIFDDDLSKAVEDFTILIFLSGLPTTSASLQAMAIILLFPSKNLSLR